MSTSSSDTATVIFDRAGRHLTAYIAGELDVATWPAIDDALAAHIRPDDERVWLDLSTTTSCDTGCVPRLLRLHQQVEEAGGRLVLYQPIVQVADAIRSCDQDRRLLIRT